MADCVVQITCFQNCVMILAVSILIFFFLKHEKIVWIEITSAATQSRAASPTDLYKTGSQEKVF